MGMFEIIIVGFMIYEVWENWQKDKTIEHLKGVIWLKLTEIGNLEGRNENQYLRLERLTRYLCCPYDHNQGFMNPNFRCGKCGFTASEFHPSILTEEVLKNTKCQTNAEGGTNESERTGEEGSGN